MLSRPHRAGFLYHLPWRFFLRLLLLLLPLPLNPTEAMKLLMALSLVLVFFVQYGLSWPPNYHGFASGSTAETVNSCSDPKCKGITIGQDEFSWHNHLARKHATRVRSPVGSQFVFFLEGLSKVFVPDAFDL
jgi:hypothetical protein